MNFRSIHSTLATLAFVLTAGSSQAAVVFSEDFNASGFIAGGGFTSTSDRFGSTLYRNVSNFNGWTFTGQDLLATKVGTNDSAVLMNESPLGRVSRLLTGLNVGQTYNLQFLLSGDNVPGWGYGLETYIGGILALTSFGIDGASGTSVGSVKSVDFIATASAVSLDFQARHPLNGNSPASPILDNVIVSTTSVPEPASIALIGTALLGLVTVRRRKLH